MTRKAAHFLAVGAVLAIGALTLLRQTPTAAQPAIQPPREVAKRHLVGAASCSASVCHGGAELGKPGSEATTWRALDPHGRAYDALLTARSKVMAKHLWGDATQAHEAPLCLKCHVHPNYEHARPNFNRADGVGCESCHGAAQDWVSPHYRATWQNADKAAHGMADTKSLPGRANGCVHCHVGTPDANVDHDLIAAGHPALRFEFSAYFANLPPHWEVARDRKANSPKGDEGYFDLQVWAVGQHVSAAAAAELLAHRADPKNGKPWPEFAEMDCFSCHHDLHSKGRPELATRSKPGALRWTDWYFVTGDTLLENVGLRHRDAPDYDPPDRTRSRQEIAEQSRKYAEARRRRTDVGPMAGKVAVIKSVAAKTDRMEGELEYSDFLAQYYFALLAARAVWHNEALINRLQKDLTFPPGYNSPHRPDITENKK